MMKHWQGSSVGCSSPIRKLREKKIPAVFMTSVTHTGILIAVSLLWGEEIDYLKAFPTSAYFHVPFPQPLAFSSFFLSFLFVSLFCQSSCFFFFCLPPPATSRFHLSPQPEDTLKKMQHNKHMSAFLCGCVNQQSS